MSMTNEVRVHNAMETWFKKGSGLIENVVSVTVNSAAGKGSDEARILFGSKYDEPGAMKLFSPVSSAPSLFLTIGGDNFSVSNPDRYCQ